MGSRGPTGLSTVPILIKWSGDAIADDTVSLADRGTDQPVGFHISNPLIEYPIPRTFTIGAFSAMLLGASPITTGTLTFNLLNEVVQQSIVLNSVTGIPYTPASSSFTPISYGLNDRIGVTVEGSSDLNLPVATVSASAMT